MSRKWAREEIEAELETFDWSGIDRMTDDEIEAAAAADPDTFLLTDEELEAMVRRRAQRLRKAEKPAAE